MENLKLHFRISQVDLTCKDYVPVTIQICFGMNQLGECYTTFTLDDYALVKKHGLEKVFPTLQDDFAYMLEDYKANFCPELDKLDLEHCVEVSSVVK